MQNSLSISCKMKLHSLQQSSSPLTTLPASSLLRNNFVQRRYFYGHFIKFFTLRNYPAATSSQKSHICAQLSSGVTKFSSSAVETTRENVDSKDEDVVFVAGATGKVGSRTVRELLKLGCRVRAGVRSAQRAESLVQSVKQMKVDTDASNGRNRNPAIEMLEIVECDLEKPEQIVPALSSASVVICCIGASEKEIFDVTGPYRIDFLATKNLIDAGKQLLTVSTVAKANHFLLVTSLGTNKFGFPAAVLNLFWGVLYWKRKAEEALIASGLPYTIVRPGGMERPTDSFKETHNLTLSQDDTLFGGLVSNLQVAELLAFMAQNRKLSYCKIVEVVAETTAPLTPMAELLVKIPSKRENLQESEEQDITTKQLNVEPAKSIITEVPTAVTMRESVEDESMQARPLSPYAMYDDLKPPSSPCPTAPNGHTSQGKQIGSDGPEPTLDTPTSTISETEAGIAETATVELQKPQPLSPYVAYEDLKPPSSPSPSPPGNSLEESLKTSEIVDEGVPKVIDGNGTLAEDDQQELIFYHSPFPVYDDFKPPTSPTPATPTSLATSTASSDTQSETASLSNNDAIEPAEDINAGIEKTSTPPKPRPLSPYTMYDDLKPPSSPMPSPGNH
ncbi:Protein TIC 62 chloroplastic [Bienertia sinuspersici]